MELLSSLKKYAFKVERMSDSDFTFPVAKQKKIVSSFPEPRDDIERSYFQYKCQMKLNKPYIAFLINLGALPLILYLFAKRQNRSYIVRKCDAVFLSEGIPEHVIPDELRSEYGEWTIINDHEFTLLKDDRKFIRQLFRRYPFSWHLLLKSIIKIGYYRNEIEAYKPSAIVVCGEYSFTSSILTAYCNTMGIKHIDVMHGEKYYYMRDSFFHFDRCYVWDEYYKTLFLSLRAEGTQFIVNTPRSMYFSKGNVVEKTVDYTYYLGGEDNETLLNIANSMKRLKEKGNHVVVRAHPRYSDPKVVGDIFKGLQLEDSTNVDIEESVLRTRNAVSGSSTVLNQAYHNNVQVVIDDISNPDKYNKLSELQYIMLNVKHKLLSEVMSDGVE